MLPVRWAAGDLRHPFASDASLGEACEKECRSSVRERQREGFLERSLPRLVEATTLSRKLDRNAAAVGRPLFVLRISTSTRPLSRLSSLQS